MKGRDPLAYFAIQLVRLQLDGDKVKLFSSMIQSYLSEPMSYNEVYSLIISFRSKWCLIM